MPSIKEILPYPIARRIIKPDAHDMAINSNLIFNADGFQMKRVYLQDTIFRHSPHACLEYRLPKYILWDRNDTSLPVHAYSHEEVFYVTGSPKKKIAFFFEAEDILPDMYKKLYANLEYLKGFDAIFTNQQRLLESLPNAHYNFGFGSWYGTPHGGGVVDPERYKKKTKNVSAVSSAKTNCELYRMRIDLCKYLKEKGLADTYGNFDGGSFVKSNQYYDEYRYHVAYENQLTKGYFDEKITDCFLSMTVPIYVGNPSIGDFFNMDGIILLDPYHLENVDELFASCNEEDYERRIPAILDNFERVQKYLCMEDYLYESCPEVFE